MTNLAKIVIGLGSASAVAVTGVAVTEQQSSIQDEQPEQIIRYQDENTASHEPVYLEEDPILEDNYEYSTDVNSFNSRDEETVLGTTEFSFDEEEEDDDFYSSGSTYGRPQLKYNGFSNRWDFAGENDELKYNGFENRWEYASEDSTLKYNGFDDRWQYAQDNETLQYNGFEDRWDYGSRDSSLQYNGFENRWERTEPGETLQYNGFEDTWSYE